MTGNHKLTQDDLSRLAEQDFVRALAACVVCNRLDAIAEVSAWFSLSYLQDDKMRHLARCLLRLAKDGEPCTTYAIAKALIRNKRSSKATLEEIADLIQNPWSFCHVRYYACQVYDNHRRRKMVLEGGNHIDSLKQGAELDPVIDSLSSIATYLGPAPQMRVINNQDTFQEILKEMEHGSERSYYFGVEALDRFNKIEPTDLIVIGARPGCGKSVFMGHQAIKAARDGQHVLFFSLEMSRKQMYQRWASWIAQNPQPHVSDTEKRRLWVDALSEVESLVRAGNLQLFCGSKTMPQMEREIKAYARNVPVDLVMIDYLQKAKITSKSERRHEQIGEVIRACKDFAMDFSIVMVVGSQLNREGSDQPKLSQLRESGDIEQESNIVVLLHPEQDKDVCELNMIVAKCRNGRTGVRKVLWHRPHYRFYDLEDVDQ